MNTAGDDDINDANRNYNIITQDHNFQENTDISLLNCKFFVVTNSFIFGKIFYLRLYKRI